MFRLRRNLKNAVAYMHELYAEGLIDPESFTQNWTQARAKVATENPAITGILYRVFIRQQFLQPMLPFKGTGRDSGKGYVRKATRLQAECLPYSQKILYPEISMRWANEWAADGVGVHTLFGPLKESKTENISLQRKIRLSRQRLTVWARLL